MLIKFIKYIYQFNKYRRNNDNPNFVVSFEYLYPRLADQTAITPIDPTYFFQDTWFANRILVNKPRRHYDIGSSGMTIGIISQFVPSTMIDIRRIGLHIPNFSFLEGSILHLPLKTDSIESLSSLCVLEHIGLGRYGDPIDPWGSEKAIKELMRVLKGNGNLFCSVPVDRECRIYFNAHRAFTREYIVKLFDGLELIEEKYIYGIKTFDEYDSSKGFGTGLYHFRKVIDEN